MSLLEDWQKEHPEKDVHQPVNVEWVLKTLDEFKETLKNEQESKQPLKK